MVNYVAFGGPLYQPGEVVSGSSSVVTNFLSNTFMWDQVRVLGGAYGGFARFSEGSGKFVYLSYRDPSVLNTLKVYDEAPDVLSEQEISSEEILQSVIGTIGDLDSPMSVDQQGYLSLRHFLTGETTATRQEWRDGVLQTTTQDFKDFAARLRKLRESGKIVVFGAQAMIEAANSDLSEDRKMRVESALLNAKKDAAP
jgi:presequence protease